MPATPPLPSLRTRLLVTVVVTNLVAVAVLLSGVYLTEGLAGRIRLGVVALLSALVVIVWASTLRRCFGRLVIDPLSRTVAATQAIAGGDASQRVPAGDTHEIDQLAASVNQMTEQLLDAHELRTRVDKLATMGRLAAGIAHEVGNPLGAIATYAHVLRERVAGHAGAAEPIDGIDREVERIDRIVRSLLDYARPRRMTPRPVEVNPVIEHVLTLLGDQGVTRRVQVRPDLDPANPTIFAERHDLEQVFVNLLLNAVDAMGGEGALYVRTRRMRVRELTGAQRRKDLPPEDRIPHQPSRRTLAWLARTDRPEAVLQVLVADSGPGVPAEDRERIFDPFFTTKAAGQGTGLGLAIVARTIENLGGTIWVQRAREGGAAFVILLPLLAVHAAPDLPYLEAPSVSTERAVNGLAVIG